MTTQTKPIELYFTPTPNGKKISIMLEELGVPYNTTFINIGKGDQFKPEFLEISPNNKIPAIVDPEGPGGQPISIFESGAIMKYLALKFGKFYPADPREQVKVDEWLFWQVGGFGPMLGQNNHFSVYAPEKIPYAIKRYKDETHRLFRVLDTQLGKMFAAGKEYVAGDYSIADMAIIDWATSYLRYEIDPEISKNFLVWQERMLARPAVQRGRDLKAPTPASDLATDKDAQKVLFNQR
ncbi:glutathione S-transferase N-terminal domain-containing protein [Devosia sp.]|jgi:GST-like protein|uniref:glutathione S-transferase N-terminal domain-containing protein n=1 Tax=Devosia sp. TaxID=1871048 RepID=UPI0037BFEEA6